MGFSRIQSGQILADINKNSQLLEAGLTPIAAGMLPAVVTYLEMFSPAPARPEFNCDGLSVVRQVLTPAEYRNTFSKVGQDWLWVSRMRMTDAALTGIIADDAVEIFSVRRNDKPIGLLELDFRDHPTCELAFFGLIPDEVGTGVGRWLMNRAVEHAWSRKPKINRLFVHTCTLDHPAAVSFYMRSGFAPYKRAIEIVPDPRLDGTLPPDAAPHIPKV